MSRFRPFSAEATKVTSAIQQGQFIPRKAVERIAARATERGREMILRRVSQGKFPAALDGSGGLARESYSTRPLNVPAERYDDASTTRRGRYARVLAPVWDRGWRGGDEVQSWISQRGNPWIHVKGGYASLRRMIGLQSGFVNLSFTGRMLEDLVVRAEIENFESKALAMASFAGIGATARMPASRRAAFESRFGGDIAASIRLRVGFRTQSSYRIAWFQHFHHGHPFALFTDEEQEELTRFTQALIRSARARYGADESYYAPRDESGAFIPFDF